MCPNFFFYIVKKPVLPFSSAFPVNSQVLANIAGRKYSDRNEKKPLPIQEVSSNRTAVIIFLDMVKS